MSHTESFGDKSAVAIRTHQPRWCDLTSNALLCGVDVMKNVLCSVLDASALCMASLQYWMASKQPRVLLG